VIETKFTDGAWMVTIAIPVLVMLCLLVNRHYRIVARRLRAGAAAVRAAGEPTNTVVLFVEALDEATAEASWYANEIAGHEYCAVHVRNGRTPDPRGHWCDFSNGGAPLTLLERTESSTVAVLDYVWGLPRGESRFVTVVIPELLTRPTLSAAILRRRTTFALKLRLLGETGIVVTNVPVVAGQHGASPKQVAARVLVSGVHAATLRAVNYVRSLGLDDAGAVFFAFDSEEAERVRQEWRRGRVNLPLEVVEAPYRDLGDPLLDYLRPLTADPAARVSVVMPELVFNGVRQLLHNQRALYIKRLLLFEPRVILSSVPYHLS
jgi:hypothetical protein